jgi:hypothetical protein
MQLGAPWGGLLTTAADVNRFLQAFVGGGSSAASVLEPATMAAMLSPQTHFVGAATAGGSKQAFPFKTGYLPLNYSSNPGVNGVSYRGNARGRAARTTSGVGGGCPCLEGKPGAARARGRWLILWFQTKLIQSR